MLLINCSCSRAPWDLGRIQADLRDNFGCALLERGGGERLKLGTVAVLGGHGETWGDSSPQNNAAHTEGTIRNAGKAAKTSQLFISPQSRPAFYLANKMSDLRSLNSVPASPIWWPIHNDLPLNSPHSPIPPFIGFIWNRPGHLFLSAGDMTEAFHGENWL